MFGLFRKKMPYEELGYIYADALLPSIEQLAQSVKEWTGRQLDAEKVGRELAIMGLAIFQMWLIHPIPQEYASSRVLGGFMQRMTERFANFAFDSTTSAVGEQYIRTAATDLRDKQKTESFPTLVPFAITRITGLANTDEYWPVATECIYSFGEMVIKTTTQAVTSTKAKTKLV
jgi:hypothetical protein